MSSSDHERRQGCVREPAKHTKKSLFQMTLMNRSNTKRVSMNRCSGQLRLLGSAPEHTSATAYGSAPGVEYESARTRRNGKQTTEKGTGSATGHFPPCSDDGHRPTPTRRRGTPPGHHVAPSTRGRRFLPGKEATADQGRWIRPAVSSACRGEPAGSPAGTIPAHSGCDPPYAGCISYNTPRSSPRCGNRPCSEAPRGRWSRPEHRSTRTGGCPASSTPAGTAAPSHGTEPGRTC